MNIENSVRILFLLVISAAITSCEGDLFTRVIDVDLDSKLTSTGEPVVFARWTNQDTILRVWLFSAQGALAEDLPPAVLGAAIEATSGGQSLGTFSERTGEFWRSGIDLDFQESGPPDFEIDTVILTDILVETTVYELALNAPLAPGAEVAMRIDLPDGQVITASDRLPALPTFELIERTGGGIDTVEQDSNLLITRYVPGELRLELRDTPNEENFYYFRLERAVYDSLGRLLAARSSGLGSNAERDERFESIFEGVVFRDRGFDGGEFELKFLYSEQVGFGFFLQDYIASREFKLSLASLSSPTYTYYKELQIARFSGGPFQEPVVLASNVEGGEGHFIVETRTASVDWVE